MLEKANNTPTMVPKVVSEAKQETKWEEKAVNTCYGRFFMYMI